MKNKKYSIVIILAFVFAFVPAFRTFAVIANTTNTTCSILSLTADAQSIAYGGSTTIRWSAAGCSSVTLDGKTVASGKGAFTTDPLLSSHTFTLFAKGSGTDNSDELTVSVSVSAPIPTCSISSFTADSTSIANGASTNLNWVTSGCSSYAINGILVFSASGTYPTGPLTSGATYTLSALGGGVLASKAVIVKVAPASTATSASTTSATTTAPLGSGTSAATAAATGTAAGAIGNSAAAVSQPCLVSSFSSDSSSVPKGGSATLSWATSGCSSVTVGGISKPLSGTMDTGALSASKSFQLVASDASGKSVSSSVSVSVKLPTCSVSSFSAADLSVSKGDPTILSWRTSGCDSVTIDGDDAPDSGARSTGALSSDSIFELKASDSSGASFSRKVSVAVSAPANDPAPAAPAAASPVSLLSPLGGESYLQGGLAKIGWSGGRGYVRILLLPGSAPSAESAIGYVDVLDYPTGSFAWDAMTVQPSASDPASRAIPPGQYRIAAVSQDASGAYPLSGPGSNVALSGSFSVLPGTPKAKADAPGKKAPGKAAPAPAFKTITVGTKGARVTLLQSSLKAKGYLKSKPTGRYTSATAAAVKKFQKNAGIRATGKADRKTYDLVTG